MESTHFSSCDSNTPSTKRLTGIAKILAILMLSLCAACQAPRTTIVSEEVIGRTSGSLGPGDVVKLTFTGASDYNQIQKVRADGMISLPMVGEISAKGKRPGELQHELAALYKSQLQNNEVVVAVETTAIPVYVSGAVRNPGKFLIERPMTVLEAVMEAGGFSPVANPSKVVLVRNEGGEHHTRVFDLTPALKGKTVEAFYVRDYDVVYVQESFF